MELKKIDVNQNEAVRRQVRALYCEAFPKEERVPFWVLACNAHRKGIELSGWMDGNTFCGMTASVTVEGVHFLLFFAVASQLRGKGYGSGILSLLRQQYPAVVLNVEPLVPDAPNLQQRQRRFDFYRRNGFYDNGWYVWEIGGKFRVLGTQQELDVPAYRKLFRKLSFGLWNVRLEKEKRS